MTKNSLENKTTTGLLEQLDNLEVTDYDSGGKYEQLIGELCNREPFIDILGEDSDRSLPAVWEALEDIKEELKLLKRHKHEVNSGDVLVRI